MHSLVGRAGKWHRRLKIAAAMVPLALFAVIVLASGTTADRVLGQFDFAHNAANLVDAKGLFAPQAVAIDMTTTPNRIYLADFTNNRVLGWNNAASFTDGEAADLVIGQADFISYLCNGTSGTASASSLCSPAGVAVDGSGNLYVADMGNSRVLEYANPYTACAGTFPCVGGAASLVFGQGGSFASTECNSDTGSSTPSAVDLCSPVGVALDGSGDLYVADSGNDRVLEYTTPLTTGVTASHVFGQGGDFTSSGCNSDTGVPTAATDVDLCDPKGVLVDSGDLYVADTDNNRVLEYNTPLSNATADQVFGQGGKFTTSVCNFDTTDGSSTDVDLCDPIGVAADGSGNLYVADEGNNRVLEYNTPLTNTTANTVFGQGGDFTSNDCDSDVFIDGIATADDLCKPQGVAVDASNNVYVADTSNNRALDYTTPLTTDTTADNSLGQDNLTHNLANLVDAQGLSGPQGVAIDSSATPNRVYVADFTNNRVLGWNNAASFTNGEAADLVIGQPDFLSYLCNGTSDTAGASSLCDPEGIAVDKLGNLYVADFGNSRVLEYANPYTACAGAFPCVGGAASLVLGQGDSFTLTGCNSDTGTATPTASDLCDPSGVAVDGSGNLYVADSSNSRVLEYSAPLSTGGAATLVFGQGGSFTRSNSSNDACNYESTSLPILRPPTANDLCDPTEVGVDGSAIYT